MLIDAPFFSELKTGGLAQQQQLHPAVLGSP
jgi:hypothetical protein